jgi:hypothetical protein
MRLWRRPCVRDGPGSSSIRRLAVERELSLIDSRVARLVEFVARGEGSNALAASLRVEKARKAALVGELANLERLEQVASLDANRIARDLAELVKDIPALLSRHKPQARQMFRKAD